MQIEWDGRKRNTSKLPFVIETPLHTAVVVDTELKCEDAIQQIIYDCFERKAVGLDCEWLGPRIYQKYGKVLVITICTPQGYCALFRMNEFRKIPKCLKDFLEDETYTKAGVGIAFCVRYLWDDFRIKVNGSLELREKARVSKKELEQRLGTRLHHIAQHLYNIYVHRDLTDFDMTKFAAIQLSAESISFAIQDAHSFIEIYKHFFSLAKRPISS